MIFLVIARRVMVRPLVFLALVLGLAMTACAHDLALTRILIDRTGDAKSVAVYTPLSRLALASGLSIAPRPADLDIAVRGRLELWIDGIKFSPPSASIEIDSANDMMAWRASVQSVSKRFEVKRRFYSEDPNSYTMVTVRNDGKVVHESLIDASHAAWRSGSDEVSTLNTIWMFLKMGVVHILSGTDHILFVLGLVLLGGSVKSLLKIVTAFTLAHSITLSLTATSVIHPSPRVVEPLIALSILAIAVENLRRRARPTDVNADYRPLIAFGFGLIHGFGFADALTNIGLRGGALATALVSFNVGVEIGQAVVLLTGLGIVAALSIKWSANVPKLAAVGSTVIGMIGSYWFVSRIISG